MTQHYCNTEDGFRIAYQAAMETAARIAREGAGEADRG